MALIKDLSLGGEHWVGLIIPHTRQGTTIKPRKGKGWGAEKGVEWSVRKRKIKEKKNQKANPKPHPSISPRLGEKNWLLPGQEPLASSPSAFTSLDYSASHTCQRPSQTLLNVMPLFGNQGWVWVNRSCPLEIVIFRVGMISFCQAPSTANCVHAEV